MFHSNHGELLCKSFTLSHLSIVALCYLSSQLLQNLTYSRCFEIVALRFGMECDAENWLSIEYILLS